MTRHLYIALSFLLLSVSIPLVAQDSDQKGPAKAPITAPFNGDVLIGNPDAPVEIIEYASFTCGHCGTFARTVIPQLEDTYIKAGQVKLIIRSFLRNQLDMGMSMIASCGTREQNLALTKKFFNTQETWMKSKELMNDLFKMAAEEGLTREAIQACFQDPALQKGLIKQNELAQSLYKVNSTPTLIVAGKTVENPNFANLKKAIAAVLDAQ